MEPQDEDISVAGIAWCAKSLMDGKSMARAVDRMMQSSIAGSRYFSAIGHAAPLDEVNEVLQEISANEKAVDLELGLAVDNTARRGPHRSASRTRGK